MALSDLLSPHRIILNVPGCKRREVINLLAEKLANDLGGEPAVYADPLLLREKLGSTAIGRGIALPHGKVEQLPSPVAAAAVLRDAGCFPAPDGIDVDIVIAFLSPDGPPEDLPRIASIVKELRNDRIARAFRTAGTPEELMAALIET
jgi:nitrogen PTS system EIIA component